MISVKDSKRLEKSSFAYAVDITVNIRNRNKVNVANKTIEKFNKLDIS